VVATFYARYERALRVAATATAVSGRLQGSVPVTVADLANAADTRAAPVTFELFGPGDVDRLAPGAITRRFPSPGTSDAEETKLALVGERLRVLETHLAGEAGANATARDKEAEKGRLQTILRRPEYNEGASKGGALDGLWKWLGELWDKLMPKRSPVGSGTANVLSVVARVFVYALAIGLIVFLGWRYGPYVWNRLSARRRRGAGAREARVVLGERLAPDQSAADLIAEAEALARAGDLRAAIRKAYIAVLCDLGDRRVIRLAQHKTNRDYLTSVRPLAELYGTMRPLTTTYERHWYGFAPATDADWAEYRTLCRQAIK